MNIKKKCTVWNGNISCFVMYLYIYNIKYIAILLQYFNLHRTFQILQAFFYIRPIGVLQTIGWHARSESLLDEQIEQISQECVVTPGQTTHYGSVQSNNA